jgi:N-methylhydantoinase B
MNAGCFAPVHIVAPVGSLVNAQSPAAVAGGNVETSQRITDVVLGALAQVGAPLGPQQIPAASQGTMNNLTIGGQRRDVAGHPTPYAYYETIGGGMGAGPQGGGLSGVQTHMTNTLNTPVEALEMRYPVRISRYALRRGSAGAGQHPGGEGLLREYEFLLPTQLTLLTERRRHRPWGLQGGGDGGAGENWLNGQPLPGKVSLRVQPGDRLTICTPGGGGYLAP